MWLWLKIQELGLTVLVFGSIYQGAILVHLFEPQPCAARDKNICCSRNGCDRNAWCVCVCMGNAVSQRRSQRDPRCLGILQRIQSRHGPSLPLTMRILV